MKARLEILEEEVNAELMQMAVAEQSIHHPITDGVVDADAYLASSPKMLWILKEPWENFDERGGGGWSVTRGLIPKRIREGTVGGILAYRRMAYVTFSVLNGYGRYAEIRRAHDGFQVGESLKSIAYINVSKFPGKSRSVAAQIQAAYQRNRAILKRQVTTIAPDVIISGNILSLFYEDFGLTHGDIKFSGTVDYCYKNGCLYVNAYHPSYWRCKEETYVNDLTTIIQQYFPKP